MYVIPTLYRSTYTTAEGVNLERNLGAIRIRYSVGGWRLSTWIKCCMPTTRFMSHSTRRCSVCGKSLSLAPEQVHLDPTLSSTGPFLAEAIEALEWETNVLDQALLLEPVFNLIRDSQEELQAHFAAVREHRVNPDASERRWLQRFEEWTPERRF